MIFKRDKCRFVKPAVKSIHPFVESLESRCLLSANSHFQQLRSPHPHLHRHHAPVRMATPTIALLKKAGHFGRAKPAAGTASPTGYTPTRFRNAYGINNVSFGGIIGDGTGQTIAIIDAHRNPNVVADLHAFDLQYGLADPPNFTVVNQFGGSAASVSVDVGWALEIALDVEWTHVVAPKANILLVEANSASYDDLLAGAASYAAHQPGVVAVSMSFGGPEYDTQTADYGSYLTTPVGHAPVTFLAATGDTGAYEDSSNTTLKTISFPSASPTVVAVGGTSLFSDAAGNGATESGWNGSGGGISAYESQPSFQQGAVTQVTQSFTQRTVPDISFVANPSAGGVSVYCSIYNGAATPWLTVGGTSLSTPAVAGLVAITAQGRALAGLDPLDGANTLLPRFYNLPLSNFRDSTTGSNGFYGRTGYNAGPGYDLVTGIGSPLANLAVPQLVSGGPFVIKTLQPTSYNGSISSVTFKFSQAIDPNSFSATLGGISSFTDPNGADLTGQITGSTWINPTTLQVQFATQTLAGNYSLSLSPQIQAVDGTQMDQNGNYIPGEADDGFTANFSLVPAAAVVNRGILYNNSVFDNNTPAAGVGDNAAIAPDKTALLPGQTATFANYTSYDKGINGLVIDATNLTNGAALNASDFIFKTTIDGTTWVAAPPPTGVSFRAADGINGSDRIELLFADLSIRNAWLQVTVKADATTGLAAPDVFYFGNLVGCSGNHVNQAIVNNTDAIAARIKINTAATITSVLDYNRSGMVTNTDVITVRINNLHSIPLIVGP